MIKVSGLHKYYNLGEINQTEILKGISLEIKAGEMVAIMGKSGSGKSTLLDILACIDSWEEGEYYFRNLCVSSLRDSQLTRLRNEKLGIVMQDFALIDQFTVLENVMLPLDFARKRQGDRCKKALEALGKTGVLSLARQRVSTLSGGEKQRTAIARAIVNCPEVLLADEPTGALDSAAAEQIMELLGQLNRDGLTVVMVTHDCQAARRCQRVLVMQDGMISEKYKK
ncbi:MAG: ABC transporter ATP-binding protein [Eubacteriales bacterium]|nr:ABC transporter ATP-binding protein [Eubacteriales bacterium]